MLRATRKGWKSPTVLGSLLVMALLTVVVPASRGAVDSLRPVSGSSLFPPACNGASQSDTEYRGAEVEPWIDVNPSNPGNLAGVWQQDRHSSGGANGLGVGVSRDGGASWTQVPLAGLPKFSRCQGAAQGGNGDYERASDPWVSFGPDGDAYNVSLSFDDTRDDASAVLVSESKDGGGSWGPVTALRRDTSALVFNDKESVTADYTDGRYVYVVWDRLEQLPAGLSFRGPTWFARTTDGGASWETARQLFDPGLNNQTVGNQIVVMPDGDLVNAYTVFQGGARAVAVIRSADKGQTWSGQQVVSSLGSVGVHDPGSGQLVRTGDILPEVASDERPGTDNVYLVWQDARFTDGQRDQIAFSRSSDGGATWSTPKRISTVPTTQAFTPAIHVDPQGNVGVSYYDFRNDATASPGLDTDVWFLRSTDRGETFTEERVTPAPFDMRAAPLTERGFFVGDYAGLAASGNVFRAFFAGAGASGPTDVFAAAVRAPFGPGGGVSPIGQPRAPPPAPRSTQPPAPNRALIRVGRRGKLRGRAAYLSVRCVGRPTCTGIVRLSAVLRRAGRRRPILLGARSFRLRRGRARTLSVRLSRRARRLIAGRKRVAAQALLMLRGDRLTFRVVLHRVGRP